MSSPISSQGPQQITESQFCETQGNTSVNKEASAITDKALNAAKSMTQGLVTSRDAHIKDAVAKGANLVKTVEDAQTKLNEAKQKLSELRSHSLIYKLFSTIFGSYKADKENAKAELRTAESALAKAKSKLDEHVVDAMKTVDTFATAGDRSEADTRKISDASNQIVDTCNSIKTANEGKNFAKTQEGLSNLKQQLQSLSNDNLVPDENNTELQELQGKIDEALEFINKIDSGRTELGKLTEGKSSKADEETKLRQQKESLEREIKGIIVHIEFNERVGNFDRIEYNEKTIKDITEELNKEKQNNTILLKEIDECRRNTENKVNVYNAQLAFTRVRPKDPDGHKKITDIQRDINREESSFAAKNKALTDKLSSSSAKIKELEGKLAPHKLAKEKHQATLNDRNKDIETANKKLASLEEKMTAIESELKPFDETNSQIAEINAKINQNIDNLGTLLTNIVG